MYFMKLIITDIGMYPGRISKDDCVISSGNINPCRGCFGCWTRTPGACVINDDISDMGALLSRCDELVIVSRCYYGSYSPSVKCVLERCLPYVHPDFEIRNGKMRHKRRYTNSFEINAYFYGEDITEKDKETAVKLIRANAENLSAKAGSVTFFKEAWKIGGLA